MAENLKTDSKQVMLVRQAQDGKLKAVTNMDKDGNIQTTEPTQENIANLLNVNTGESFLEAFFKKLLQEMQNPSHTGIFILAENALSKLIKIDLDPDLLNNYRVDPQTELNARQGQKSEFQPMDTTKIDQADMNRKGIKWEDMEPHLKAMSYGHKSHGLIDMNPELEQGGIRVATRGRIKLEEQPDGTLRVIPFYKQDQPNLDAPFYNIMLDDEAKTNLMNNGNAGKVIDLELTPGRPEPCFVSIDRYTNALEPMPTTALGELAELKGVKVSQGTQIDIAAGRKALVEGMTSRNGYKFDAYVQVNASDRKLDFTYEGIDRKRYTQENRVIRREKQQETPEQGKGQATENTKPEINIHKQILGAKVPDEAYNQWSAAAKDPALQKDVKAFYIKGMVKEGQKDPFNAWVKPDFEDGRMRFYKWNPHRGQKQGTSATSANVSREQKIGKTNETTNVPPKQDQQQRQNRKTRGPKM